MNQTPNTKTIRVMNALAAGTSNQNSSVVDTAGFEVCRFIALFGTLTATAVTGIKVQQGLLSDGSDMADLADTAVAIADTGSNKALIVEVRAPRERYLRLVVTRGTANAVIDGVVAVLAEARSAPVTADASVVNQEYYNSPAEGTA